MAIVVGLQLALAIVLLVGLLPLILWARSTGHSVGRLLVVVLMVLIVLVAVFAVVVVTIKRRRR
jgi:hypothetical protein